MTDLIPYPLPPTFLVWLEKFLGDWSDGDSTFQIRRRADGWLEAYRLDGSQITGSVPVGMVIRDARKVCEPASLLGPYPVLLSPELIRTWLTPKQCHDLQGAWNVSTGRQRILEAIEERIRTLTKKEIIDRQIESWARGTAMFISTPESEEAVIMALLSQHRSDVAADDRHLVYKKCENAVFAPRRLAEWVSQIYSAISDSRTWGEFRVAMPADEYARIMEDQFDREDEPRPSDDSTFEPTVIWGVGDGDYPPFLAQSMDKWIPSHLLQQYATIQQTAVNGDFWEILEEDADKLADDLRALGFYVTEAPELVF